MIGLADCNNFYVSCERVFNPSLRGKPVLVLSNNDGSAIARSQEAKKLGIKMGQKVFKIRDLIQSAGVVVLSSNYTMYADMSERVVEAIRTFIPRVEVYSIDEVFVDLEHLDPEEMEPFLTHVRAQVLRWTGIPISIGVAPTKTLAKAANKIAKDTSGVYIIREAT
jgi:DNA polymerase V